jgi:hypothetical protein
MGDLSRRQVAVALLAPLLAMACTQAALARPVAPGARIAPPAQATCARDKLTAYFGKVIEYRRGTSIKIATDYGTVEAVSLERARFLYRGGAFTARDWSRIESRPGVLRAGTRATAWVCEGGTPPALVDWNGATE